MKKILFSTIMFAMFLTQDMYAETFKNADDICYDNDSVLLDPHGVGGCIDIGPFRGGLNCTMTIPLRNVSEKTLTDTTIIWDIDTGFEGNMIEKCGIDGSEGGCQFDAALDFGPIRMFENSIEYAPMPNFSANGENAKHSIFFWNLMSGSVSPLTMFRGDDLYGAYTKDGDNYSGRIRPCQRVKTPVGHLCYDYKAITYDGAMCVDFGPFKGGMGCKQTIPIRSLTDQNLTAVEITLDQHGMSGDFLQSCGIDNVYGNCDDKKLFNFGPMGMFTRGILYDFPASRDYNEPYEKHSIYVQSMMSMGGDPVALFTGENMYTHYSINGEVKSGYIPPCPKSKTPVPDLCYEYDKIDYSGFGCVEIGPFKGGAGCKQTIPIRNISNSNLTNMDIFMDTHGMSGNFLGGCGIDNRSGLHSTCEVQNRFDFGPMGFFSSGVLFDPMANYGPFDVHNIYTSAAMSMGGDPIAFFLGENLYANYMKDGALVSGRILPCKENYTDDLCIENINKSIAWSEGWFSIPIGIKNTAVIKNQRSSTVTKVSAVVENNSFTSGDCELDNRGRNKHCADQAAIDFIIGFGGGGTAFYETPHFDFDPYDTGTFKHKLQQNVGYISGLFFDIKSIYANFVRNGEFFSTELSNCLKPSELLVMTGSLDAWDRYRHGIAHDPAFSDREISTKIVNEPFTLTIASLNAAENKYEVQNISTKIYYDLYQEASITPVLGVIGSGFFDGSTTTSFLHDFTVPDAYRDLRVGFKFCSTHRDGKHQLQSDSVCPVVGDPMECDQDSATAQWHVCKSTDNFAVRPKNILISTAGAIDPNTLRSGRTYSFDVKAAYWDGATPRAVQNYNKTLNQDDINKTLILATNVIDDTGILSGDLYLTNSSFTNGEGTADILFTDVAKILIRLEDKEWAAIDNDDTPESCEGGFKNGTYVPDGTYLCGAVNSTFIPDHFALKEVVLKNHDNGDFTYLSKDQDLYDNNNDINMSAHIELLIVAENALGDVTENFKTGAAYYENPVSVALSIPAVSVVGQHMTPYKHDMNSTYVTPTLLNFALDDDNGTYHLAWDTNNTTQKLNFNYEKDLSIPVQPFTLDMSDINITVQSVYGSVTIKGKTVDDPSQLSGDATFHYAKVDSTRALFDNITTGTVNTPIRALVYCPSDTVPCSAYSIDTAGGSTTDEDWWLSTAHQQSRGDGDIKLRVSSTSNGTGLVSPAYANIQTAGITNTVEVIHQSGTLPQTVNVGLDPSGTSPWMMTTGMGYGTRFTGITNWAGHGPSGYVIDSNASLRHTGRIE